MKFNEAVKLRDVIIGMNYKHDVSLDVIYLDEYPNINHRLKMWDGDRVYIIHDIGDYLNILVAKGLISNENAVLFRLQL